MSKINREKRVIETMIKLYCQKKEGNKHLCKECEEVINYALKRLDNCKFGEEKPTCRLCPIHCYNPQMKSKIKEIMRYSGPRLIIYNPLFAIEHSIRELLFTPKSRIK